MLKIKKYESDLREFYLGKICVFEYRNLIQGVKFVLKRIKNIENNTLNLQNEIQNLKKPKICKFLKEI